MFLGGTIMLLLEYSTKLFFTIQRSISVRMLWFLKRCRKNFIEIGCFSGPGQKSRCNRFVLPPIMQKRGLGKFLFVPVV